MMAHDNDSTRHLLEIASISLPTSLLAGLGYFAHTLATCKKLPDYNRLVGGVLLSGFVACTFSMLLLASGMAAEVAAPLAAIIGSSGERGFNYLLKRYMRGESADE